MIETYVPPVIEENEPVFIRHSGEVVHDGIRKALVELLSFRLDNDLNHVQFMAGYGMGPYLSDEWPEEHRTLLLEWEKQTRRLHKVANELQSLGTDPQPLIAAANYWLQGGSFKQPLFATAVSSWNDMLVWRWLRARAQCARSASEFGSIYVPLNDIAFQTYFDLGLTRWPADSALAPVERVRNAYRKGARDELIDSLLKWYPIAVDYLRAGNAKSPAMLDMRLWTRPASAGLRWFERIVRRDLDYLGVNLPQTQRAPASAPLA